MHCDDIKNKLKNIILIYFKIKNILKTKHNILLNTLTIYIYITIRICGICGNLVRALHNKLSN